MRRLALTTLLLLSAIAIAITLWWREEAPAVERRIAFDSGEWLSELRDGAEVTFVHERRANVDDRADATPTATSRQLSLKTLGPLPDDQLPALLRSLGVTEGAEALARAATKAESGLTKDYADFLFERYAYAKVLAAERMVRDGSYLTVPRHTQLPVVPEGFHVLGQLNVGVIDGQRVDAYFVIDTNDGSNPGVYQAAMQMADYDGHQIDEDVVAFNSRPLEERTQLINRHDAASRALRNWPKDGSRTPQEAAALRRQQLPIDFSIDRQTCTVTKRHLRRY